MARKGTRPTLVLGIGNLHSADEGVGIRAVNRLRDDETALTEVDCIDGGTLSISLIPLLAEYPALIVIDAARLDAAPGTVALFEGDAMEAFLQRQGNPSPHGSTLLDLLTLARLEDALPERRALIAIQPQTATRDEQPGAAVVDAIPRALGVVERLVTRWQP